MCQYLYTFVEIEFYSVLCFEVIYDVVYSNLGYK